MPDTSTHPNDVLYADWYDPNSDIDADTQWDTFVWNSRKRRIGFSLAHTHGDGRWHEHVGDDVAHTHPDPDPHGAT